jgi:hypothetical protein
MTRALTSVAVLAIGATTVAAIVQRALDALPALPF